MRKRCERQRHREASTRASMRASARRDIMAARQVCQQRQRRSRSRDTRTRGKGEQRASRPSAVASGARGWRRAPRASRDCARGSPSAPAAGLPRSRTRSATRRRPRHQDERAPGACAPSAQSLSGSRAIGLGRVGPPGNRGAAAPGPCRCRCARLRAASPRAAGRSLSGVTPAGGEEASEIVTDERPHLRALVVALRDQRFERGRHDADDRVRQAVHGDDASGDGRILRRTGAARDRRSASPRASRPACLRPREVASDRRFTPSIERSWPEDAHAADAFGLATRDERRNPKRTAPSPRKLWLRSRQSRNVCSRRLRPIHRAARADHHQTSGIGVGSGRSRTALRHAENGRVRADASGADEGDRGEAGACAISARVADVTREIEREAPPMRWDGRGGAGAIGACDVGRDAS